MHEETIRLFWKVWIVWMSSTINIIINNSKKMTNYSFKMGTFSFQYSSEKRALMSLNLWRFSHSLRAPSRRPLQASRMATGWWLIMRHQPSLLRQVAVPVVGAGGRPTRPLDGRFRSPGRRWRGSCRRWRRPFRRWRGPFRRWRGPFRPRPPSSCSQWSTVLAEIK